MQAFMDVRVTSGKSVYPTSGNASPLLGSIGVIDMAICVNDVTIGNAIVVCGYNRIVHIPIIFINLRPTRLYANCCCLGG